MPESASSKRRCSRAALSHRASSSGSVSSRQSAPSREDDGEPLEPYDEFMTGGSPNRGYLEF